MRTLILALLVLLVLGCAEVPTWKEGATKEDYQRDMLQCEYEAKLATPQRGETRRGVGAAAAQGVGDALYEVVREQELIAACMKARGYTRRPNR